MTPEEFDEIMAVGKFEMTPTYRAIRLVVVNGLNQNRACVEMGINNAWFTKALRVFPTHVCPLCRQLVKDKRKIPYKDR